MSGFDHPIATWVRGPYASFAEPRLRSSKPDAGPKRPECDAEVSSEARHTPRRTSRIDVQGRATTPSAPTSLSPNRHYPQPGGAAPRSTRDLNCSRTQSNARHSAGSVFHTAQRNDVGIVRNSIDRLDSGVPEGIVDFLVRGAQAYELTVAQNPRDISGIERRDVHG